MADQIYIYCFGNTRTALGRSRLRYKGKKCKVIAWGGMRTCLVEFLETGERITCSRNALRKGGADALKTEKTVSQTRPAKIKSKPRKETKKNGCFSNNLPRLHCHKGSV